MTRRHTPLSLAALLLLVMSMVLAACGSPSDQSTAVSIATEVGGAVDGGTSATTGPVETIPAPASTIPVVGTSTVGAEGTVGVAGTVGIGGTATVGALGTVGAEGTTTGAGGGTQDTSGYAVQPGAGTTSKGSLNIYASLPLTGSSVGQTTTIVNGMKLALEQRKNAAGGYQVNFKALDDATAAEGKWTIEKETQNANTAIRDKVTAYLGTYNSGAAAVSIPLLNEAGIPMISPANTAPELTKKGFDDPVLDKLYTKGERNYFRVVPADDLQGAAGANFAKQLGATSAYILHDNEVYGKGIATVFRNTAPKVGLEVAGFEPIDPKASDYQSLMDKVVNSGADIVYFGGLTQTNGGVLLKGLRAVASADEVKFMGPDGIFEEAFIKAAGADNAEGVYATFAGGPYDQLQGNGAKFYEDYKAKYNSEPEAYAIFGYDTMKVALDAIDKAGSKDPAAVLKALKSLGTVDGALGTYSFNENGDTSLTSMNGYTVKGGKWTWQQALNAATE